MRVLVATDGSPASEAAVREAATRQWPAGTELEVFTVVTTRMPSFPDPSFAIAAAHETLLNEARERAPSLLEAARATIQDAQPHVRVTVKVTEGHPKDQIVAEAEAWGADLILLGAHGWGVVKRVLLGSVSQAVASHAPCSVEIVRSRGSAMP